MGHAGEEPDRHRVRVVLQLQHERSRFLPVQHPSRALLSGLAQVTAGLIYGFRQTDSVPGVTLTSGRPSTPTACKSGSARCGRFSLICKKEAGGWGLGAGVSWSKVRGPKSKVIGRWLPEGRACEPVLGIGSAGRGDRAARARRLAPPARKGAVSKGARHLRTPHRTLSKTPAGGVTALTLSLSHAEGTRGRGDHIFTVLGRPSGPEHSRREREPNARPGWATATREPGSSPSGSAHDLAVV